MIKVQIIILLRLNEMYQHVNQSIYWFTIHLYMDCMDIPINTKIN